MKISVIFIFLFCVTGLSAQNWMPVHTGEKLVFLSGKYLQYGAYDTMSTTLWVDSVRYINGDSTYYINKLMRECPGCTIPASAVWKKYLINQPSFLLSQFIKKVDRIEFRDSLHSYMLPLNSAINSSFIFDTLNNITGLLLLAKDSLVLNQQDSVRLFVLSNLDTVVLSKNLGIIKFPWFKSHVSVSLAGLENAGVGLQTPMFHDIFCYHTGDIFEYFIDDGAHFPDYKAYQRVTILQKLDSGNMISYQVNRKEIRYVYEFFTLVNTLYTDTVEVVSYYNLAGSFYNKYAGELLGDPACGGAYRPVYLGFDTKFQCYTKVTDNLHYFLYNGDTVYSSGAPGMITGCYAPHHPMKYGRNTGLIMEGIYNTDTSPDAHYHTTTLNGAMLNGVMYGSFNYNPFFGIERPGLAEIPVEVFPNPATNRIQLKGIPDQCKEIQYSIYNGMGSALKRAALQQQAWQIDISDLPGGVYYLHLVVGSEVVVRKFLKM